MSDTIHRTHWHLTVRGLDPDDLYAILEAADEGGTIQADRMVELGLIDPTHHTTCTIRQAIEWAGGEIVDE